MYKDIWDELISKYGEEFDWGYYDSDIYLKELNNELTEKHPLYNKIECFVGKCFYNDDVLYLEKNGKAAIVHLGWPANRKKDISGEFPTYTEFLNLKSAIECIEREFIEGREKTTNTIKLPQDYKIPNGCDINIFCKYTNELASYLNEELISQFFKEYQKDVIVSVKDDKSFKFINITEESFNMEIASEYWKIFDDNWKNEYKEDIKDNPNEINIINKCNSVLFFDCRTREEVILVLYLSLYMSKYTDSILVCDNYNGFDFRPSKNELVNMTIKSTKMKKWNIKKILIYCYNLIRNNIKI